MSVLLDPATADYRDLVVIANRDPLGLVDSVSGPDSTISPNMPPGACRALAIAHRVLGDARSALGATTEGRRRAAAAGDERAAAMCDLSSAPILAQMGRVDDALAVLERSEPVLSGLDLAELRFQRGGVFGLVADYEQARADYTKALATFRRRRLSIWEADALMNRGLMSAYLGDTGTARRDLDAATTIFEAEGDTSGVAGAQHNRALTDLLAGDPVGALHGFETSNELFTTAGIPFEPYLASHCEALLSLGLRREAIDLAVQSIEALVAGGNTLEAAGQRLVLARALVDQGNHRQALAQIEAAENAFRAQGQIHRARRAELARCAIDLITGDDPITVGNSADRLASYFATEARTPEWSGAARLLQARALIAADRPTEALDVLQALGRRTRSFSQEVERAALVADALFRTGRTAEALRTVRRGLRTVDLARAQSTSSELTDALSHHVIALNDIGLRCLLGAGRSRHALLLTELSSLTRDRINRPAAPAPLLIQYRALGRSVEKAENEGRNAAPIRRRRRSLARVIRRNDRHPAADPAGPGVASRTVLPDRVTARRHVVVADRVWALDLVANRVSATELCDLATVRDLSKELLFRARAALSGADPAAMEQTADRLDDALGRPGADQRSKRRRPDDAPITLIGDGLVPPIPFGLLPSLRDRRWSMATGLTTPVRPTEIRRPAVLVGGPNLVHAQAEIEALALLHNQPLVVGPAEAKAARVTEAIDGADLVHVAAHSSLNDENPMFSCIHLTDGEFTVHELRALVSPPSLMVLASCDSAATVGVGTSMVGLAYGLLRVGVETVIGTVCEIPDSIDTVAAMSRLHHNDLSDPAGAIRNTRNDPALSEAQQLIARCLLPVATGPVVDQA